MKNTHALAPERMLSVDTGRQTCVELVSRKGLARVDGDDASLFRQYSQRMVKLYTWFLLFPHILIRFYEFMIVVKLCCGHNYPPSNLAFNQLLIFFYLKTIVVVKHCMGHEYSNIKYLWRWLWKLFTIWEYYFDEVTVSILFFNPANCAKTL